MSAGTRENRSAHPVARTERLADGRIAPGGREALNVLQSYVDRCGLDRSLLELVKIRASQINGCAFCLSLHVPEAMALGESSGRLHQLAAWEESGLFTPREEAALAWTEAVTSLHLGHVPDEVFERARRQFSDKELVDLTWAIVAINAWNRISVSFRRPPRESRSPR